nr:lysophospholipid acyltransferase LPEAT2 [Tanacetum cinerariifolium]GFB96304.1 lysophospholipid acyltransferase LPEAT2 [Tanacetum cinerariifolium]
MPAIGSISTDEIHGLFNLFDGDADGRISKADFVTCLRRNPLLIALFAPHVINKDLDTNGAVGLLEEIV